MQERRLKARLRKATPSEPWVEAQIRSRIQIDPAGEETEHRYYDPTVFPPGGAQTAMVRCPECGVFMPPLAFEGDTCLDHSDHLGWDRSPSAITIEALQYYHVRLDRLELLPDSKKALRQEIIRASTENLKSKAAHSRQPGKVR